MIFQKKITNYLFLHFLFVCFLIFAIVIPGRAAFIPALENQIHALTNQEREAEGLAPLWSEPRLVNMARQHSEEMATLDYFDHISPVSGYEDLSDRAEKSGIMNWRRLGENIGNLRGASEERMAEIIVDAWMDSAGHRENILDDSFTHLGVGVFELDGEYYFTQNFAAFSSDPSAASPSQYSSSGSSNNNIRYPRSSLFNTGMLFGGTSYGTGFPFMGSSLGMNWPFGGNALGSIMPYDGTYFGAGFPFSGTTLGTGATFGSGFPMGGTSFGIGFPYSGTFLGSSIPFGGTPYGTGFPYGGLSFGTGLPYGGVSFGMGYPFSGMPFGTGSTFAYGSPFGGYTFW